jgi:hypothetical protein
MTLHTRVTRLDGLATVRRARRLPYPGDVLTPVGQQVGPVQVVARAPDYMDYQILRASNVLQVKAEDLEQHLLVEVGELIEKGTPIMSRPGIFGRTKIFRSPVEGYVDLIHDGCLVVHRVGELIELRAQLPGRVVSIIPERGVIIEAIGALIQAVWDNGKDGHGQLLKASDSAEGTVKVELIGSQARGKVLVAGMATDLDVLHHFEEQGVRGLIVGSLTEAMCNVVGDLTFPVIATDGIGNMPMAEPIFHYLDQSAGRDVSLLAADHGPRSQPAEIFIPLPAARQGEIRFKAVDVGSTVRILRPGGDFSVGTIIRLQPLPHKNSLGTPLPGADVELNGGERKFVPYTNLELLHG